MLTVLIIGLGSIAKKHIEALKSLNIEVKFYALRSTPNATQFDSVINIYELESLVEEIDFAIISNPTNLHSFYISLLTNKKIPLFIEKPPIDTLNDVEFLLSEISKMKLMTYIACNLRFHPCIEFVKNYLDLYNVKKINEVNVYCGSFLPDWRPETNYKDIYSANKAMGGGVHLDLFHEIDYVKWFFNTPINVSSLKRNNSTLNIDAYDYANYTLSYPDFVVSIVLNYYRKDAKRNIEILFEDETWTIDLLLNKILSSSGKIIYEQSSFSILQTYTAQMEYFLNCLSKDIIPMNTFEESLDTLKICLANE